MLCGILECLECFVRLGVFEKCFRILGMWGEFKDFGKMVKSDCWTGSWSFDPGYWVVFEDSG